MGAAVVEDPEDAPRGTIRLGGHDLVDESAERLDPGGWLTAPEELGPMDVLGSEILEGPPRSYSCSTSIGAAERSRGQAPDFRCRFDGRARSGS
jgi:hypothetical protein